LRTTSQAAFRALREESTRRDRVTGGRAPKTSKITIKEENYYMPEVTAHTQGAPSWADLSTTDETGAIACYSAIFGWTDDPQPMGENGFYHMQKLDGLEAAAIYQQSEEERNMGIPAHWNLYFTAADVDSVAEQAVRMGATIIFGPTDVFDAGRTVAIQDPQGAHFFVWQPKEHIGARVKDDPGAMTWNELLTTNSGDAIEFYTSLLGLERGETMAPMDYTLLRSEGTEVLGVMQITPDMGEVPPNWSVYFAVDDVDATVAQTQSLGGGVIVPATDIPDIGRFAVLTDPQGAFFNIFKGA
jgi:predicted enzyme related to lactoylglutathione lyase